MVRVWFSGDDLARTRLIASAGPLAEASFSLVSLHGGRYLTWRHQTLRRLPVAAKPVLGLYPGNGLIVDLVSPTRPADSMDAAVDQLMRVPQPRLELEVADTLKQAGSGARSAAALIGRGIEERRHLAQLLRAYHDVALQPHWSKVQDLGKLEISRIVPTLVSEGVEQALKNLQSPGLRWDPPVLHVDTGRSYSGDDADHYLGGRGLIITWSPFDPPRPRLYVDPGEEDADLLVCPIVGHDSLFADTGCVDADRRQDSVAALIGSARERVLASAVTPQTTTGLARLARLSMASASRHAAILRAAGLLTSRRLGGSVYHTATPLGVDLLAHGNGVTTLAGDDPAQ